MNKSYRNFKLRSKLLISFALMIAVALIIGSIGYLNVLKLRDANAGMYRENTMPMGELASMYDTLATQRICAANMAIFHTANPSFAQEETAALTEKEALFEETFASYKDTITTAEEQALYDSMNSLYFAEFKNAKQEMRNASAAGDAAAMATAIKKIDDLGAEISGYMDEAFALNVNAAANTVAADARLANRASLQQLAVVVLGVLLAVFCALYLARLICDPLKRIMSATTQVAETGNMNFPAELVAQIQTDANYRDEIGLTARGFAQMLERFIENCQVLDQIASGDLSVTIAKTGPQDTMGNAMETMVANLNQMFGDVNAVTAQVSVGASQIADGALNLSQGATEQASSVQELSSIIAQVLEQTRDNAHSADDALATVNQAGNQMEATIGYMQQLQAAMSGISDSSSEISKIIKVIDDIAFQTNILALNAAVEAARAGQHGKGFAVVAEEVRSLASKSAAAAQETSSLIQTSISHVEQGNDIARKTGESVEQVAISARSAQEKISAINAASKQQEEAISQINSGVEQISQVVQTNSAAAEESAAAGEELSGQAGILKELVSRFKLAGNALEDHSAGLLLDAAPLAEPSIGMGKY